jgi:hypothetical protein
MRLRLFAVLGLSALGLFAAASPAHAAASFVNPAVSSFAGVNTGWYDHQQIWYAAATVANDTVAAANLAAQGQVVYHIENADGITTPIQQLTFPVPPTGGITSSGNVLSAIPTEVGYNGGAWNLKVFIWNGPATRALTKDDDILAAVASGEGRLMTTQIVVRCPLINFSELR